jgi:hypothetical protein
VALQVITLQDGELACAGATVRVDKDGVVPL